MRNNHRMLNKKATPLSRLVLFGQAISLVPMDAPQKMALPCADYWVRMRIPGHLTRYVRYNVCEPARKLGESESSTQIPH
jgi:hypothetical protein